MAEKQQTYQSLFVYGETGDALGGFRDSTISKQSAKEIRNFYITEMGTLRVAKSYSSIPAFTSVINLPVMATLNTKFSFFIVFTQVNMYTVDKATMTPLYSASIAGGTYVFNETCNVNIFNNFIFVKDVLGESRVFAINENGQLGTTNFFSTIKFPFQNKQDVGIDVYKCFLQTDGKTIKPELMATYPSDAKITVSGGVVYLGNSGMRIDRVYEQYKSLITGDQIGGATNGLVFAVFKNFQSPSGTLGYYLDNTQISFTGRTNDATYGSYYYTGGTPVAGGNATGKLIFGNIELFAVPPSKVIDIVEFQSRLCIATDEKLYFSKILDYNDFVPDIQESAGFFIKLSTIDGNQPQITKMTVGNGLYVCCTEGIIVVGYGTSVSSTNLSNIKIAGNSKPSKRTCLIEDIFYYLDSDGLLRAILPDFDGGVIKFANVIVENYDYDMDLIEGISRGVVNGDNVLLVTPKKGNYIYVYSFLRNESLFRRYSLDIDNYADKANQRNYTVFGYRGDVIVGQKYLKLDKNKIMKHAYLVLNLPFVNSATRGVYLNDFMLRYSKIVVNILSQRDSVKRLTLNDNYSLQKMSTQIGNYNIWDFAGTLPIIDLKISLETSEKDHIIELRGINGFI